MENKNKYGEISQRIAVWGPSGSGKTWLINAFGRSLMSNYAHDQNFSYELSEYTGKEIEDPIMPFKLPLYEKTIEPIDFIWSFQRRSLQFSYAHKISAHTHILHIQDINGDDAFKLTDEIKNSLMGVDFLILLLDPVCLNEDGNVEDSSSWSNSRVGSPNVINQEMYYHSVVQLLSFLAKLDNSKLNIAVCVAKKDLWKNMFEQDSIIRVKFGQQMEDLIRENRFRFKLKTFAISSCGYLHNGIGGPNFNPNTGWLLDVAIWKPEGVAAPFFWFLENVELESLNKVGGFFEKFVYQRRVKKYIPYPY